MLKLNHYYNKKIDEYKSDIKLNNKNKKKLYELLIKRSNKINHYFNLLVKWLTKTYKNKIIIIGYNCMWIRDFFRNPNLTNHRFAEKNKVNLGKKLNRKFYCIPYKQLIDKLFFKCKQTNCEIILNEESYTSKCDALAFEPIKRQRKYLGNRYKRGLFSSSIGKYINADLNG